MCRLHLLTAVVLHLLCDRRKYVQHSLTCFTSWHTVIIFCNKKNKVFKGKLICTYIILKEIIYCSPSLNLFNTKHLTQHVWLVCLCHPHLVVFPSQGNVTVNDCDRPRVFNGLQRGILSTSELRPGGLWPRASPEPDLPSGSKPQSLSV